MWTVQNEKRPTFRGVKDRECPSTFLYTYQFFSPTYSSIPSSPLRSFLSFFFPVVLKIYPTGNFHLLISLGLKELRKSGIPESSWISYRIEHQSYKVFVCDLLPKIPKSDTHFPYDDSQKIGRDKDWRISYWTMESVIKEYTLYRKTDFF